MQYIDTRGGGDTKSFKQILIEGLAPSGGLYVPERYPQLDLPALRTMPYQEVALAIFQLFAPDIPRIDMAAMIYRVYTKEVFGSKEITPVKMLAPGFGLLQLSNGPTLAFKDVAMQMLAQLLDYVLEELDEYLNILGGTSGDTGSAAEEALKDSRRVTVFMLSPDGRMSKVQQDQMYTISSRSIHNLAIRGTFDNCQDIVKTVNDDEAFKKRFRIGAVNSINWARIVAQVVYYAYGYFRMTTHDGQRLRVIVPSGNFGNALAAYIAREMGVPIDIVIGTNENDVLDEFFRTGYYRVRKDVLVTTSPSMDISKASNLERLIFDLAGRNGGDVRAFYEAVKKTGVGDATAWKPSKRSGIRSGVATMDHVLYAIKDAYLRYGAILDPHTAVSYHVAHLASLRDSLPALIVETALPAKFEDTIREAIGIRPPIPSRISGLSKLSRRVKVMDNDPELVKAYIRQHAA